LIATHSTSQQRLPNSLDSICLGIGYILGGLGCQQWDVLLSLLPNLVVDNLTGGLNGNGCYTVWYAGNIVVLISRKFPNTISELLTEGLNMVQLWCDRTQLSINPQKMVTVPFTKKKDLTLSIRRGFKL
jgi:hypothetical protein